MVKTDEQKRLERELEEIERQLDELKFNEVLEKEQIYELNSALEEHSYIKSYESVYNFLMYSWNTFEPGEFKQGKHLHAIGEHLDACLNGEIRNLIINIAPRNTKTAITTRAFPTYAWIKKPELKFINISYSATLATDDSVASRQIITSEWYQKGLHTVWKDRNNWERVWKLDDDKKNQQHDYYNTVNGRRYATSTGGTLTGTGGDIILIDDPLNANNAFSETEIRNCNNWCSQVLSTRLNDKSTGVRILIMQRLAPNDLTGYLLDQGGWELLKIPTEWEESKRYWTSIGWTDWRTKEKELMNPERFPREVVEELKIELKEYNYAAQHQQEPLIQGGGVIKEEWYEKWYILPSYFDSTCMAFDLTFKGNEENHNNAFVVMGKKDTKFYLIDLIYGKMDIVKQLETITNLCNKYPYIRSRLIENRANGNAVYNLLEKSIPGLITVDPKGIPKVARISTIIPIINSRKVYIPDKNSCSWVNQLLKESNGFPKIAENDVLDAMSYAINYLEETNIYTQMPAELSTETKENYVSRQDIRREVIGDIFGNAINTNANYIRGLFN